jgi:hypothetical protein
VLEIVYPAGKLLEDEAGSRRVYEEKVEIKAHVRRTRGDTENLEVSVSFVPEDSKRGVCLVVDPIKVTVP